MIYILYTYIQTDMEIEIQNHYLIYQIKYLANKKRF